MTDASKAPDAASVDTYSPRDYARWLRRVVAACAVFLAVAAAIGRYVFVWPVFDLDRFQVAPDATTLIAGASHSATAFNPQFFDASVSMARNAEPVFLTFHKLQAVLARNPQIERVLMAVSATHISPSQDELVFAGDAKTRTLLMVYYPFIDEAGRAEFSSFSEDRLVASAKFDVGLPLGYMDDLRLVVGYYRGHSDLSEFKSWGGFDRVPDERHLEQGLVDEKLAFYFRDGGTKLGDASELALTHLAKIVDLCAEKGIGLTFVSTPFHERFRAGVPASFAKRFAITIEELRRRNPALRYFDYSERYAGDEFFYDGDHLSGSGADAFSREFAPLFARD